MEQVEHNDSPDVIVGEDGVAIVVDQVDPNAPKVEGTPVQVIGEGTDGNKSEQSDEQVEVSTDSAASDVEESTEEA